MWNDYFVLCDDPIGKPMFRKITEDEYGNILEREDVRISEEDCLAIKRKLCEVHNKGKYRQLALELWKEAKNKAETKTVEEPETSRTIDNGFIRPNPGGVWMVSMKSSSLTGYDAAVYDSSTKCWMFGNYQKNGGVHISLCVREDELLHFVEVDQNDPYLPL